MAHHSRNAGDVRYYRRWLQFPITAGGILVFGLCSALLPVTVPDTRLGLAPEGYLAVATSGPVVDSVRKQLNLELSPDQLRGHFKIDLPQDQTISYTASANSAEQSILLANTWLESYQKELKALLKAQFNQMKAQALQEIELLLPQLASAEEKLARLDLEYDQSLWKLKLSALEARRTRGERRLKELMAFSLPIDEGRLALPHNLIGLESGNIGGGGEPDVGEADGTSQQTSIPRDLLAFKSDPTYIELSRNLMLSQLSALEQDLVSTETRIRELNLSSIPTAESRLVSLEKALATEPELLSKPGSQAQLTPNPVYLALSQDRADTRILLDVELTEAATLSVKVGVLREQIDAGWLALLFRQEIEETRSSLAIDRREAEVLETTVLALRPEIRKLRARVNAENSAHRRLASNVIDLQAAYDLAQTELDRLVRLEDNLGSYSRVSALPEPTQSTSPVPTQRPRNIALAMFLGLVIGVCAALMVDYYQGRPTSSATPVQ